MQAEGLTAERMVQILLDKWFARHGTPSIAQSDNGKQFVAEVTDQFMRVGQLTQVNSTANHPATQGLVERHNRTLLTLLKVFCSRQMNDWDEHLDEVVGAYNSTRHASTGFSPHMLMTAKEKSIPLSYVYPEFAKEPFESHQDYVTALMKRQREVDALVRRNTHQAQLHQKKAFDRKVKGKAFQVGDVGEVRTG